jgi:hypothetical protein
MYKKMKKIIVLLVVCILGLSFVGCGNKTYEDSKRGGPFDDDWGDGYFTIVESWGGIGAQQYMIVYANDTKVMYFIDACSVAGGMTPLYNADGTLQIYDEE